MPRVADVEVGLVAEHEEVVAQGQFGEPLELSGRALGAGGVLQVVEDEEARAWA